MLYLLLGTIPLLRTLIIEVGKSIRISQLQKIDNSKIESISNYERKSKNKYYYFPFFNKKHDT